MRTVEPEKQSRCCMASLILHEAVPGHHLLIALAREMENVPEFRKTAGYTAFSEGWGLYAEALGEDLGIYKDPYEMYGRLQTEMMRAARHAMRRLRPDLLVLAVLELCPNLIAAAKEQGTRVAIINGRLSDRSFRGYRRLRPLVASVLPSPLKATNP